MEKISFGYFGNGAKRIAANRNYLMKKMGYQTECCLLDEVEVIVAESGEVERIVGRYLYDISRSTYFAHHVKQVCPGLGGDGEFMTQTCAAGAIMAGSINSIVLFEGADKFRVYYPITHGTELTCVAIPSGGKKHKGGLPMRYYCRLYRSATYKRLGEDAKVVSEIVIRGTLVVPNGKKY